MLLGLAGLLVVALVAGYWWQRPLLMTGTGYAAHNACALEFVAGRDDPATDLPPNPLVPYLRSESARGEDAGSGTVDTTILGVLSGQRAVATPGFGCAVGHGRPELPVPVTVTAATNPLTTAPTPADPGPEIAAALDAAFGDDLDLAARQALGTRAVLVLHDGDLVAERYADGFDASTPQLGWSMAKSVANLLTGRLVAQGLVSLDDAGLRPGWDADDPRSAITIEDLLRMRSGLAWDETYALGTAITSMLYLEPDMAGFVAEQPLAHDVGTYQQYSSGSTNLLCWVLTERAGGDANLPRTQLFAPMGLSSAVLEADASGLPVCSSYLWATARDWATIGQFALADGVWGGQELLPSGWMTQSTTDVPVNAGEEVGYAAGWWVNDLADGSLRYPDLPRDAYWASGHDGQRLYVVPSADLVVVRLGFSPGVAAQDLRANDLVADLVAALP